MLKEYSIARFRWVAGVSLAVVGTIATHPAAAQTAGGNLGPGLIGLPYANEVERAAAIANDQTFRSLDTDCNPGGILDQLPSPTGNTGFRLPPGPSCSSPDVFFVYLNSRELFQSANEIQGQGPTTASLGVDLEGLGTALRWTAAEEFAAQGSMATEFAANQLSNLAARLSALRYGAGGFGITGIYEPGRNGRPAYAEAGRRARGGAAQGETLSPWGGFLNLAYGYGGKDPTSLEDAFDFDGSEYTLGVDYRLGSGVIFGGMFGFSRQALDFNEAASAISVVDGEIDSDAKSFMFFVMYQGDRLALNGSIGTQSIDYDATREIEYPSFNPNLASVSSTAQSHPQANATTATFGVSWAFTKNKFTFEPEFRAEYLDATVDAFAEQRSINRIDLSGTRRFDLAVSQQSIGSLDSVLGFRFQYVLTPRFGVIIPYWSLEAHKQLQDDSRVITAGYAALSSVPGFQAFQVPTDKPDDTYSAFAAGFSVVFRGGRQRTVDGPVAGGLMGFVQFKSIENLQYYDDQVITGGFRYEF
jgi:uncharacterized protein YhjY with autotransporter beta-barrel domain